MAESEEIVSINVTVDIAVSTLKTIVENAKKIAGPDEKGFYRVDTAEKVNEMVTGFLIFLTECLPRSSNPMSSLPSTCS